ncbi:MAG: MarC family protein [Thermoanaerobaculia bacterium]
MPFSKVAFLSFVALITMVNPLAVVPSFIAITRGPLHAVRRQVAFIAGLATIAVLTGFFFFGNYVFKVFGITVPAFQIMGGVIFFANGLRTLMEDEHRIREYHGTKSEDPQPDLDTPPADAASIAVVPLGIPMLSGPGAITTTMVLVNLYPQLHQKLAVVTAIIAVGITSWLTLLAAVPLSHIIGERGRAVFAKVMALLLGAIGVQFVVNGIKPLVIEILQAS